MESQEHPHHLLHIPKIRVHVKRSEKYKFNGTGSYLYALRKYKFNPPSEGKIFINEFARLAIRDHGKNEIGQVSTSDVQNDSMYLCPVTIGEGAHAVTLHLDFDTGSSDLWVFSSELPKSVDTSGHAIYNPTKSPTAKPMVGATWQIGYGDGSSASGNVYTDTVTLGGLVIKNQAVECAKQISSSFSSGSGDGLLGLAFDAINTVQPGPAPTPVQNMGTEGVTPKGSEIFTCKLTRHTEAPGYYTFGHIDAEETASAKPIYFPIIDSSGFWKVNSMSAVVGTKVIKRSGNTAICDTGTTLCLVDTALCKDIYSQIPGAKFDSDAEGWVFPTGSTKSLPTIQIGLGDPSSPGGEHRFNVYPDDLAFAEASPGFMYGGFQDRGDMGFDILGDVFLKNVYAIWDVKGKRFGAVQRKPGPFIS